jgi:hypothetical protein
MSMTRLIVKYIFIINIYRDTNIDTLKELKDVHSFLYGGIEEIGKQLALRYIKKCFFCRDTSKTICYKET